MKERIRLDDDDIRVGLTYELEAAKLSARLELVQELARNFAFSMRDKYAASSDEYELSDWLRGFVRKGVCHGE